MTKRFTVVQGYNDRYCQDLQTNELLNQNQTVELLNHLHEENQELRKCLNTIYIISSRESVE